MKFFTFSILKMFKSTAHQRLIFKIQNSTYRFFLDLELSIFFKIFEFYHDPSLFNWEEENRTEWLRERKENKIEIFNYTGLDIRGLQFYTFWNFKRI
jgi:hypothetical protein